MTEIQSVDYFGYTVFSDGRIFNKKGLLLKVYLKRYVTVGLFINKKYHFTSLHRILALCFIPNPENLPQVNHIDGNKYNNSIGNLEWVTAKRNVEHAFELGLSKKIYGRELFVRPVIKINQFDQIIEEFPTIKAAAIASNRTRGALAIALKKGSNCVGAKWKYKTL